MNQLQKLPVTESGFQKLREQGLLYVDKTKQILIFLEQGSYLFLSRPRRFGKSLLLTTLKALFEGKKELFEGLYIYDKWDWQVYPVVHLDFSALSYSEDLATFKEDIVFTLKRAAKIYDIEIKANSYKIVLKELLWLLSEKMGNSVVVLVDEYDKPITDFIGNPIKVDENRELLNNFFTALKAEHTFLHKVIITGVSKLAKVSVFSGMNNALDLTLFDKLSDVLGLTKNDIEAYFAGYIDVLQKKIGFSKNELLQAIKHWYDGYSWDAKVKIYNPFSIIRLFHLMQFENYWFQSGTPTMLIDLVVQKALYEEDELKKHPSDYENIRVTKDVFDTAELNQLSVIGMLFQTGYLTITNIQYEDLIAYYTLNYPNYEVKWSFAAQILEKYAKIPKREIAAGALRMKRALRHEKHDNFLMLLRNYFSIIPYQLRENADEAYYHSLFQMVFTLIGIDMLSERATIDGRIDGVVEFDDKIYIIEFKHARKGTLNTLINKALTQIKSKRYVNAYKGKDKKIYLLGVGFLDKLSKTEKKPKLEVGGRFELYVS